MDRNVIYKPYKSYVFWANMMLLGSLGLAGSAVWSWKQSLSMHFIVLTIVSAFCNFLACYLLVKSKDVIILDTFGMKILNTVKKKDTTILWSSLYIGYIQQNYKGYKFLVLSPKELNTREIKQIVNKAAYRDVILYECFIVIPISPSISGSNIVNFVRKNLILIDDCGENPRQAL